MTAYIVRVGTNMTMVYAANDRAACVRVFDRFRCVPFRTLDEYMERGYISARRADPADEAAYRACTREASPAYRKDAKTLLRQMRTVVA